MNFEQLVRQCIYNWLGYGNTNGREWFVGMEEGGAEIWRHGTKTLEESLSIRSTFEQAMGFRTVWEEYYHIPLASFVERRGGLTVWHFMAAFLLGLEDTQPTIQLARDFVFKNESAYGFSAVFHVTSQNADSKHHGVQVSPASHTASMPWIRLSLDSVYFLRHNLVRGLRSPL